MALNSFTFPIPCMFEFTVLEEINFSTMTLGTLEEELISIKDPSIKRPVQKKINIQTPVVAEPTISVLGCCLKSPWLLGWAIYLRNL
jgi:hypothetical protein